VAGDSCGGKAQAGAAGPGGPNIWFTRVPRPKTATNGCIPTAAHLCHARTRSTAERLGAAVVHPYSDHVLIANPEGN